MILINRLEVKILVTLRRLLSAMSTDDDYVFDYTAINNVRIFTIVIGSISTLFPLSVVVILIQKYNTLLVRGKSLVHYVMMIAIADTMTAISIAFGLPEAGPLCSAQAFLNIFFSRMSWFFTDVLIFQLFYIVVFKKYFLSVKYMHCIVWSVNILLQILPYTTGTTYGALDDEKVFESNLICFLGTGTGSFNTSLTWMQYAFNIELFISIFIIIILSIAVVFYSLNMKSTMTSHVYLAQRIRESWSIVILYPCAMLVAWVPSTIYIYYSLNLENSGKGLPYNNTVIIDYLNAINALYGPFLALIFYTKTLEARRAWISNFKRLYHFITNSKTNEDEDEERCGSIISMQDIEITTITITSSITSELKLQGQDSNNQVKSPFTVKHDISSDITRIDDTTYI